MKVLLLPSWYPDERNFLNGVFFKEQAEALTKNGVDVIVLSINILSLNNLGKVKPGLRVSNENGVKVYRYYTYNYFPRLTELYLRYYGHLVGKLVRQIEKEEEGIELVHIHSAIDAGIAYSMSNVFAPYVITEHSSKYQRNILNKTQKKYLKDVFLGAKKVIAVGNGLRDALNPYIGKESVDVIPNLVSLTKETTEIDKSKKKFRFFSLGILTKTKGMDLLIEAFSRNKDKLIDCELYIGGDGEEFSNLVMQIDSLGLNDQITLLGKLNREEVAYHMNNCDSFVLASRFETFGIVFLEAMIYGKPVIGAKTGGPDTFINEDNGLLVKVEDIDELGNALVLMNKNSSQYNSDLISKYCYDEFSENVICNKIIRLYNEILNNKK